MLNLDSEPLIFGMSGWGILTMVRRTFSLPSFFLSPLLFFCASFLLSLKCKEVEVRGSVRFLVHKEVGVILHY